MDAKIFECYFGPVNPAIGWWIHAPCGRKERHQPMGLVSSSVCDGWRFIAVCMCILTITELIFGERKDSRHANGHHIQLEAPQPQTPFAWHYVPGTSEIRHPPFKAPIAPVLCPALNGLAFRPAALICCRIDVAIKFCVEWHWRVWMTPFCRTG